MSEPVLQTRDLRRSVTQGDFTIHVLLFMMLSPLKPWTTKDRAGLDWVCMLEPEARPVISLPRSTPL